MAEEKKFKEKYGFDLREMKEDQALIWLDNILSSVALGSLEETAYPEVMKRLKSIYLERKEKIKRQEMVIDYALEKLNKKDIVLVTKLLLGVENENK